MPLSSMGDIEALSCCCEAFIMAAGSGVFIGVSNTSCLVITGVPDVSGRAEEMFAECRRGVFFRRNAAAAWDDRAIGVVEAPADRPEGGTDLDFFQLDDGVITSVEETGVDVFSTCRAVVDDDDDGVVVDWVDST